MACFTHCEKQIKVITKVHFKRNKDEPEREKDYINRKCARRLVLRGILRLLVIEESEKYALACIPNEKAEEKDSCKNLFLLRLLS